MWIHYIKLSIRNSLRNKVVFLQRLINLSVGLTVALLTFLYIYYETGYEKNFTQHLRKDEIPLIQNLLMRILGDELSQGERQGDYGKKFGRWK